MMLLVGEQSTWLAIFIPYVSGWLQNAHLLLAANFCREKSLSVPRSLFCVSQNEPRKGSGESIRWDQRRWADTYWKAIFERSDGRAREAVRGGRCLPLLCQRCSHHP